MNTERDIFLFTLRKGLGAWNLPVAEDAAERMWRHFTAMIERNRAVNLTRITEPRAAAIKHYVDSLAPLAWLEARRSRGASTHAHTLLDVGTGAGFPAVPLAIARPDWRVTGIDGTAKKTKFVAESVVQLGLDNLKVAHAHATQWRSRQRFDLVLARAIGSLADFLRGSARFMNDGGFLVAYKSAAISDDEQSDAASAASESGLRLVEAFGYELRMEAESIRRSLLVYEAGGD